MALLFLLHAGRWEWYKRLARHGMRGFGQTLHLGLAVLLVGGGLLFEYSHAAIWQVRNKGVSRCRGANLDRANPPRNMFWELQVLHVSVVMQQRRKVVQCLVRTGVACVSLHIQLSHLVAGH